MHCNSKILQNIIFYQLCGGQAVELSYKVHFFLRSSDSRENILFLDRLSTDATGTFLPLSLLSQRLTYSVVEQKQELKCFLSNS